MLGFLLLFNNCEKPRYLNEINGFTMGTSYSVKIIDHKVSDLDQVSSQIDSLLIELNNQTSTWDPNSEISKFNRNKSDLPIHVSSDFYDVIKKALNISNKTDGAFDITIFELMSMWGFGPNPKKDYPKKSSIKKVLNNNGWQKVSLQKDRVLKLNPNLKIDLNSIAKGYAVDKVHQKIKQLGFKNILVEIGGEVKCSGKNLSNRSWRLGIENPQISSNNIISIINLSDKAMATSGNYRNFIDMNGLILGHTLDPRLGEPTKSEVLSATVTSSSCMVADAWATALMVMSFENGRKLIESDGDLDALWILDKGKDSYGIEKTEGIKVNPL